MNFFSRPRSRASLLAAILLPLACYGAATAVIKQTGRGLIIGTDTEQAVGFHGATPTAQRSGSAQAAVTATVGAAVATTAATNSGPYGFSQAQADALVARVNSLRTDVLALTTANNELRAALVQKGLIKGSN